MLLLERIRQVRDRAEIDRTAPLLQFRASVHSTGEESNGAAVVDDGVLISLRHRTNRTQCYRFAVTARACEDGSLLVSFRRVGHGGRTTVCYREEITPKESAADPRHEFASVELDTRCQHCRLPAEHQVHAS